MPPHRGAPLGANQGRALVEVMSKTGVRRQTGELRAGPWVLDPEPLDGTVADDEVWLRGRRVVLGNGDVVAAVMETLRYRARSEGYHGGAALAEMAIPFVVLSHRGESVSGREPAEGLAPVWWHQPSRPDLS